MMDETAQMKKEILKAVESHVKHYVPPRHRKRSIQIIRRIERKEKALPEREAE